MKQLKITVTLLTCTILIFSNLLIAKERREIKKTFSAKEKLVVKTVSGDCIIRQGEKGQIKVHIETTFSQDHFKPEFEEDSNSLVIREKFYGSASGMSSWSITVPQGTEIQYNSASGDFSIANLDSNITAKTASGDIKAKKIKGELTFSSASGDMDCDICSGILKIRGASSDIELDNVSGKVEVNVASGDIDADKISGEINLKGASSDIEIKNTKGTFNIKSASGDLDLSEIELTGASKFKTASGDVIVRLAKTAEFDLTLASASGDSVLDFAGNKLKGYFEFTARVDRGTIESPFPFDKEETFTQYGQEYQKKSLSKGGDNPKITVKTASGRAVLHK